jgi:rfaE bifunctional protein kinase chain/domain
MNPVEAAGLLERFSGRRILIVGDVMLDRYLWGTVTRLSPEAPVPIVAKQRATSVPGGAANVAVNVAALGGRAILFGVVGVGPEAADLEEALKERGVSADGLVSSRHRRTTVKTRIIAHSQQLVRVDEEQTDPIDPALAGELFARIEDALPSADALILSDYAKGVLTPELLRKVIELARQSGLPVLVDPKSADYSRYRGASLLTPNRAEALLASGLPQDASSDVAEAGRRLMRSLDLEALLITEGSAGMTLFERPAASEDPVTAIQLPACARAVYDVTGAGDTVVATLGLARSAGASLKMATFLANVAAGLAVEQVGTAAVTPAMLENVLTSELKLAFAALP